MISWMAENKEWLFDGIGVLPLSLAATGFGAWIVRRRRDDKKNQPLEYAQQGTGRRAPSTNGFYPPTTSARPSLIE